MSAFSKAELRSQAFIAVSPDCYCASANTTYGVCRNYANNLFLRNTNIAPILIKICNRQAALHAALFNYTPLVISED
jgi:hypothetical protein